MQEEDQQVLQELIDRGELGTVEYHPKIKVIHEKNNARIKEIIKSYGWPGISAVGKEGSEAAWLIVQHAVLDTKFMNECLSLLREAVHQGEAEGWCLAYLQDRVLTMSDKPQIYGTPA
jgi:predicted nucleic acid-binding protein